MTELTPNVDTDPVTRLGSRRTLQIVELIVLAELQAVLRRLDVIEQVARQTLAKTVQELSHAASTR